MKKRVILYILSVIGIVILNCLYVNFEFMVMLVMVIVIPLFSYIIFSISKHGMKIFVKINNSVVSVGDNIDVRIIEGGNSLFGPPEGVLKAQIRYSNDGDTKQAEVEIGSGSMRECSLDFKPKHIGIVNIYFTELKVTDYIRFFSTTYDYNCIRKAIVFPQKKDGSFRAVDYQNEEDEFVLSFEETDNTEVLDLREFADGDSVNKIHWKLSMNSDDFIVRQYGEEVEKRNTIIVDLTKVKTDKFRDKLDLIYEAAYLLGLAYLEDGISARFVVWDGLEYDITSFDFDDEADQYHDVIYKAKNEQEIQQYIKQNRKWFIPGSIFLDYNFGHHDAYLFPEQKLGNEYAVDYMLLGKNSDGYSIVLVEFEKSDTPYCRSTANIESESVKEGLAQIKDWQRWMLKNQDYFMRNIGLTQKGIDIPIFRIFYYLVVSRRDYMNDIAHDMRSQTMYDMRNLKIVTFDRLEENVRKLANNHSW